MADALSIASFSYYPEILLAFACFLFLGWLRGKNSAIPNWPVLGMLPSVLLNFHRIHEYITEVLKQTSCSFMFMGPWFTNMNILITCDPIDLQHIFVTHFHDFPKGPEFNKRFDILGNGISNSDQDSWAAQRKLAHYLISNKKFRAFVVKTSKDKVRDSLMHVLISVAEQKHGAVVDLQDVFQRFAFDVACILVLGVDPTSLSVGFPTVPFAKAMDDALEAVAFRHAVPESWWVLLKKLNMGKERKLAKAWKTMDDFINQQLHMRRKELMNNRLSCEEAGDLVTSYMNHELEDDMGALKIDSQFLRDTAFTLLLAGRDTTSAALSWFFWLLSTNPRVEEKLLEELNRINSTKSSDSEPLKKVFDAEELSGAVYLHAALCEAMRLFPPVPFEHKSVFKTQVLPTGHIVEPGTMILTPFYAMGRMESIWGKDCMEFKPERWISERGKLKFEPAYKFIAFNAGPRICLGKDVAFIQMKTAAAALLYNFEFQVLNGKRVCPQLSIILRMKNGLKVKARKRGRR